MFLDQGSLLAASAGMTHTQKSAWDLNLGPLIRIRVPALDFSLEQV
jgi:hypothetical protein